LCSEIAKAYRATSVPLHIAATTPDMSPRNIYSTATFSQRHHDHDRNSKRSEDTVQRHSIEPRRYQMKRYLNEPVGKPHNDAHLDARNTNNAGKVHCSAKKATGDYAGIGSSFGCSKYSHGHMYDEKLAI
jgi:hypothetical protein